MDLCFQVKVQVNKIIDRLTIAGEQCVIFKPKIDNRYTPDKVCTHSKIERGCVVIREPSEIVDYLKMHRDISVVAVDEAQFFDNEITKVLESISNAGYDVLIAGLDKNFRGEPFGPMQELICLAEYVHKLTAVCNVCGNDASYTQRIINGQPADYNSPTILVGEKILIKQGVENVMKYQVSHLINIKCHLENIIKIKN